jgi:hypothetical protein
METKMHNNKAKMMLLIALTASMLVGCVKKQEIVDEPSVSPAIEELRQASVEARDELRLLAKARDSLAQKAMDEEQRRQRFFQATTVPAGFEQPFTLDFAGDAVKAAEAISRMADYRLVMEGKPSRHAVIVDIHIDAQPLNEALHELGAQTGDAIMIEVYPNAKLMKLVFQDIY